MRTTLARAALIIMCALAVAGRCPAGVRRFFGHLPLAWPSAALNQELAAYLGTSLFPVPEHDPRPTTEQRLHMSPFVVDAGGVALNLDEVDEDSAHALLGAAAGDPHPVLSFGAFVPVAEQLYLTRRYNLATLALLYDHLGLGRDPLWRAVDVRSIIAKGIRRIRYNVRQVLEPVAAALRTGKPVCYATTTWFVAEHLDANGRLLEAHTMGKRPDMDWDYALYDGRGYLQIASEGDPAVRAPTTCWTCHRTSKRVSPFLEFPAASAVHEGLLPEVLVTLDARQAAIVQALALDRTGDDVLGHYAGLAALELEKLAQAGPLPAWAQPVWQTLKEHVPQLRP